MIYLDNAATTPVDEGVLSVMRPYWSRNFGNPGSITKLGVLAKQAVENARKKIADNLNARPVEIIFTAGGTESNNLAIFGLVRRLEEQGRRISEMHFITTNIEHSSVTECFKELARRGAQVDYLPVNEKGLVESKDLRKLIKQNTVLVSVGYANGEIGTIQPIREIAKEIRHARKTLQGEPLIVFHTDASQAGLYCNLNIMELGVDMMTLDAQKIYGPKGVGVLFKKSLIDIAPIILGGGQEKGLRSGTENVPLILGMSKALELARKEVEKKSKKMKVIRDYFWQEIKREMPEAVLNGDLENRLPNNLNISIPGTDSEFMVLCLDEEGIVCSTRSACGRDENGSAVVRALGRSVDLAKSTLRFSLGEDITKKEINFVVTTLKRFILSSKIKL